jgi:hypothetical protein
MLSFTNKPFMLTVNVLIVMFYYLLFWYFAMLCAENKLIMLSLCWVSLALKKVLNAECHFYWVLQISPLMLSVIMLGVTFFLLLCWVSFLLSVANEPFMLSVVMLFVTFYSLYADWKCADCDVFSIAMLNAENKLFMLIWCWIMAPKTSLGQKLLD